MEEEEDYKKRALWSPAGEIFNVSKGIWILPFTF